MCLCDSQENISEKSTVKTDLILPALLLNRCSYVRYKFILTRTKIHQLYDCVMYNVQQAEGLNYARNS